MSSESAPPAPPPASPFDQPASGNVGRDSAGKQSAISDGRGAASGGGVAAEVEKGSKLASSLDDESGPLPLKDSPLIRKAPWIIGEGGWLTATLQVATSAASCGAGA